MGKIVRQALATVRPRSVYSEEGGGRTKDLEIRKAGKSDPFESVPVFLPS